MRSGALRVIDGRALLAGGLTALGVIAAAVAPVRVDPGSAGWPRLVRGADVGGSAPRGAVLVLPGLARHRPSVVRLEMRADGPVQLGASVDGSPVAWFRPAADG